MRSSLKHLFSRLLFCVGAVGVLSAGAAHGESAKVSYAELLQVQARVRELFAKVRPAVVAIQIGNGTASGVIVNESGLVLTAAHVAETPGREVRVVLDDGRKVKGTTLGLDKTTDAALVQLHDTDLHWPFAEIGRSVVRVTPGDWCFALGHPGGFDKERGVVLRVGRVIRHTANSLQTDCVLMGGDSGGPLFNLRGEVIGIHSQIWEARDHNMHVSMAPFLRSWEEMKNSLVIHVWGTGSGGFLGASVDVNAAGRVEVLQVLEGSPAKTIGLLAGDVVEALDAQEMRSVTQFSNAIRARAAGDEVMLKIQRGPSTQAIRVRLASRPKEDEG